MHCSSSVLQKVAYVDHRKGVYKEEDDVCKRNSNSVDERTQHASTQYAAEREKQRRERERRKERGRRLEKEGSKTDKDTELG